MARGKGILRTVITVHEIDESGNEILKKRSLNEDYQIPTTSEAMSAVDKLAVAVGQTIDAWGDGLKQSND